MHIKKALTQANTILKESGIESSFVDSTVLMQHVLQSSLEYIISNHDQPLTFNQQEQFFYYIDRRKALEPIAYIVGYKEFYSNVFYINNSVLIPRSDTETLIDAILTYVNTNIHNRNIKILELGTGSGCIIITLLLNLLNATGVAIDISLEALDITQQNATIHQVASRLQLMQSNWFTEISVQKFDIIVSNPPYIILNDKGMMSQETILYEPHLALFGGKDYEQYHDIAKNAIKFLSNDSALFLEIGYMQSKIVQDVLLRYGYYIKKLHEDINGIERVIIASTPQLKC